MGLACTTLRIYLRKLRHAENFQWYSIRKGVNNTIVMYDVIRHDKTEYSSHALAEVGDGKHKNNWILVTKSMIGKWRYYQD